MTGSKDTQAVYVGTWTHERSIEQDQYEQEED